MMESSSKHLKQLLNEDQEPFVLKNYINDKRSELNKPAFRTTKKRINACFLSFHDSSEGITKSPRFDFSSQSRNSNPNTVFVHIPAKTAALLLEAALRIQNQSEKKKKKKSKSLHFGLFDSILERLRRRKKKDIKKDSEIKVSVKDILRWESNDIGNFVTEEIEENSEKKTTLELEKKRVSDVGLSCSSNSRVSSAWTESNEEKSLDLETSTTSSEETEFISQEEQSKIGEFNLCKDENPFPFQFILQNGSSPSRRSPELLSPATSPNRRKNQVVKNNEGHFTSDEKKRREQKEQFSPVSVLDVQIGDDVEGQDEDEPEEDDGELERSFAFVQKAKQKLLLRLRRFEQLAELDPMELEKRIAEDEEDEDNDDDDSEEDDKSEGSTSQDNDNSYLRIREIRSSSNCSKTRGVPLDMKRLLIDLMNDERTVNGYSDRVTGESKLCRRWASMKDVERNTVKTMIEMEFRGERTKLQTSNSEHVEETVVAIELAIFGFLIEELSVELMDSSHLYYRSFEDLLV
ncbi:histone-lysine N-methyltransferase SETD1B-like protein [Thalictrum thalictroides]|uniref:Histone-lysine N-methyltransferase SETD1B-like protein n=1 Tax=Thalictrum thalictroides TaxID=46969 RepID=A0A7J6VKK2_THATH|nr:histone-lysine N-methyltransferase SETD1B-like protein [Thalictrum thalictroides]